MKQKLNPPKTGLVLEIGSGDNPNPRSSVLVDRFLGSDNRERGGDLVVDRPFVVADAVGSRKAADKEAALARMRSHGVEIVTREMVAFEWLHDSAGTLFREINRDFIRDN